MTRLSWDEYGLAIARVAARRSEDPWLKVGACILRPDQSVAATGYNGAPSGFDIPWTDRDSRRSYVIHAEANAFRYCTPAEIRGGVLYVTHHPCLECVKLAAGYGIGRVLYAADLDPKVYNQPAIRDVALQLGVSVISSADVNPKEDS